MPFSPYFPPTFRGQLEPLLGQCASASLPPCLPTISGGVTGVDSLTCVGQTRPCRIDIITRRQGCMQGGASFFAKQKAAQCTENDPLTTQDGLRLHAHLCGFTPGSCQGTARTFMPDCLGSEAPSRPPPLNGQGSCTGCRTSQTSGIWRCPPSSKPLTLRLAVESATTQTGLRLVCLSSPWDEMQSCSSGLWTYH